MSKPFPFDLVADIAERYQIKSLHSLIDNCRIFERENTLNIAVLGRFKAGKSSFLNDLLGLEILPVGVVPVTAIICEIAYGPLERVTVRGLDGGRKEIASAEIPDYVDERRNPENIKNARLIRIELPTLDRFKGICFIDTPGLDSLLAHNTEASRNWLPSVGLAVVAVSVDPPLSQRDVELIRDLHRYTPNVSVLLTKVDMLDKQKRTEVQEYVRTQLERNVNSPVPVLPYSIRPGYEYLRDDFARDLISEAVVRRSEHHESILARKSETLLYECVAYLTLALKAADVVERERQALKTRVLGEKGSLEESKWALCLIARHAQANTRSLIEKVLKGYEPLLNERLLREFNLQFPEWTTSLRVATERFEEWLASAIGAEINHLSTEHRIEFTEPLSRVERQLSQTVQDFRNRISDRAFEALGISLPTTEVGIDLEAPRSPDIRVGKIFDRNWELLAWPSASAPPFIRPILRHHWTGTHA